MNQKSPRPPPTDEEFEEMKRKARETRAKRWGDLTRSPESEAKLQQRMEEFSNMVDEHRRDADDIIVPDPQPDIGWSWSFSFDQIKRFFKR
jgi:hypothetical protein